jgi:hypothetical protein
MWLGNNPGKSTGIITENITKILQRIWTNVNLAFWPFGPS